MPPSFTPLSETKFSENAPFQKTQSDNIEYKINIKRTTSGGNFLRDIFLNNAIKSTLSNAFYISKAHAKTSVLLRR